MIAEGACSDSFRKVEFRSFVPVARYCEDVKNGKLSVRLDPQWIVYLTILHSSEGANQLSALHSLIFILVRGA
jgi:hypothetical protein